MTNRITYLNQEIAPRPNDDTGDIRLSPYAMNLQCWFTREGQLAGKKESDGRCTSEYHYTFDGQGHLLTVSRDRALSHTSRPAVLAGTRGSGAKSVVFAPSRCAAAHVLRADSSRQKLEKPMAVGAP